MVASKPLTFVKDNTGMLNASQKLIKSAAFSAPFAVNTASNFSATLPSSSTTSQRFATAPTVTPFNLINPVTISFAYAAFVSKNILSSAIIDNATDVSPTQFASSADARFKSSVQST